MNYSIIFKYFLIGGYRGALSRSAVTFDAFDRLSRAHSQEAVDWFSFYCNGAGNKQQEGQLHHIVF